jgi:hypothetical protein
MIEQYRDIRRRFKHREEMESDKNQSSHSDDSTADIEDGVVAVTISFTHFDNLGPT